MKFHPLCLLFPEMETADLAVLTDDIKINGLGQKIVLLNGMILDGRNRYRACLAAGVKPTFVTWQGLDKAGTAKGTPADFVVSQNLNRRHLTSSQRAVLALDLLAGLEVAAKERQRNGKEKVPAPGQARDEAARKAKTNGNYVQAAKKVAEKAPELLEHVRSGALKIKEAKGMALVLDKLPAKQKKKILASNRVMAIRQAVRVAKARTTAEIDQTTPICLTDALGWLEDGDGTLDLMMSVTKDYKGLAELAALKLRPGGLVTVECFRADLPAAIEAMRRHLQYWNCFVVRYVCQLGQYKFFLTFAKPPVRALPSWAGDLLNQWDLLRRLAKLTGTEPTQATDQPADDCQSLFGFKEWSDKTVNCLAGCPHDCLYCEARGSAILHKRTSANNWSESKERKGKIAWPKNKLVAFPSTHDIVSEHLDICLETIHKLLANGNDLLITSKPHMECTQRLCADLEAHKKSVVFRFTVGAFDNAILKFWEPGAPSYDERMSCLQYAYAGGFTTSISAEPALDLPRIVELFHRLEPWVSDKIWIGTMNKPRSQNKKWREFNAEIKAIEANQTPEKLRETYESLKDEPKVEWKESFLRKMRRGTSRPASNGAGLPLANIAASTEPLCV